MDWHQKHFCLFFNTDESIQKRLSYLEGIVLWGYKEVLCPWGFKI